jgi:alginate O-acetyltransferase complex protein AlgI
MLFITFQFAIFLLALLLVLRLLRGRRAVGNGVLLAASLAFYTLWIPAYLPLLLADIGVNYALLRAMTAYAPGSTRRRTILTASITFTIGLLAFFKYAAFMVETALPALQTASLEIPVPDILLPLGISFYSFQIVSFAVDSYREDGPPVPGLADYALYIAFFPQLIAGPILRGKELLPQIAAGMDRTPERTRRGLWLLASGIGKKVLLADFLLAPFADEVFGAPGVGNARFHWVGVYAFAFQIYFDFSGYTDMARGIGLLFGYELPENFHEPYLSRSPQEFWQRWHMTLSRWLSLYLFVPISRGLLRRTRGRQGRLLMAFTQLVTMALCGLWHGAGWHFVVWGVLQGVLLVAWPARRRRRDPDRITGSDLPSILLFFHLFCVTLVFFRAPDATAALSYIESLFVPGELPGWPRLAALAVALSATLHVIERWLRPRAAELQSWFAARPSRAVIEAVAFGVLAGAAIMVSGAGGEFIYFQF